MKRPFLPGFEEGVPNLLLCPQGESLCSVQRNFSKLILPRILGVVMYYVENIDWEYLNFADEILNTVLTIYSHDPEQPLPQSDEILMCTPHTTLDEVQEKKTQYQTISF